MGYEIMTDLSTGQVVTEAVMDTLRGNIEFLAGLRAGGVDLADKDAAASLTDPDYDSGWDAVTYASSGPEAYEHSLGSAPQRVVVLHSAVATPGESDEIGLLVGNRSSGGTFRPALSWDDTHVYVMINDSSTEGVIYTWAYTSGAGYIRVLAWV